MEAHKPRPRELAGELLEAYILEHRLQPGDKLPSERELCQRWSLNRSTLRSAMAAMERDGILHARPNSGTYLAPPKFVRNLQDLHSLSWTAADQQRVLTSSLLSVGRMECDKTLAKHFGQMLGYPVYKVVRLRSVDSEPLMVETAFIPAERAEGLQEADLEGRSLFAVLEEYGMTPERGEESIGITYATAEEAALLAVDEEAPLFWLVTRTYDQTGALMEYCRTAARPDRVRLTSVLHRWDAETGGPDDEA
ncbi:GntR family transcriptional regulator [Ruminococcaceae bacterium OttesenSCG-928-D13]|nr:GntR family transcriptional regulator [Ruminococcaceae bacterium OttesenSCG-928-D13]